MNLFALSLLLVLMPILLQLVVSALKLYNRVKFSFGQITFFNTILLFVMIFVGLDIINTDAQNQKVRCGMPGAAFFFFSLIALILFLVIVLLQLILRRKLSNNYKKNTFN